MRPEYFYFSGRYRFELSNEGPREIDQRSPPRPFPSSIFYSILIHFPLITHSFVSLRLLLLARFADFH
jgi:hypothetical protein